MLIFHDIGECRIGDIHRVANRYINSDEERAVKEQTEKLDKIGNEYLIVLDIFGKSFSSFEFSEFIKKINKNITFIIGSETGISESLKNRADLKLSLSRMTFLHEMSQLILLEQAYRAFSILKNTGYHK